MGNSARPEKCPVRTNRHTTRRLRTRAVLLRFEKHAAGTSRDAERYNGRAKPGRLQNGALWSDRCIRRHNARDRSQATRKVPRTGNPASPARKPRVPAKNASTEAQRQARRDPSPETRPPAKHAPPAAKRRGRRRLTREILYTDQSHGYGATTARQSPSAAKDSSSGKDGNRPPQPRGRLHPRGGKHLGTKDKQARREALKGVQRENVPLTRRAPQRSAHMGMPARQSNRLKKSRRKIPMKELN